MIHMPSSRRIPLILAIVLSIGMLAGAFVLSSPAPVAEAVSTEEILRAYAAKDTDQDGLPDWQEVLYGTDPENPRSVSPDMTDADAVAEGLVKPQFATEEPQGEDRAALAALYAENETVTDKFGRKFAENFLEKRTAAPLTEADMRALVESASTELSKRNLTRYSTKDIVVGERGQAAALAYLEEMDRVLVAYSPAPDTKDILEHFGDYVQGKETSRALLRIRELGKAYTVSAEAVMKVPVPPEFIATHLDFANAFAVVGEVAADMGAMDTDPLRGLIGVTHYTEAWSNTARAFAMLGKALGDTL